MTYKDEFVVRTINEKIRSNPGISDKISDGYHTFWELYKHRIHLFIALCSAIILSDYMFHKLDEWEDIHPTCIKSKLHEDGSSFPWWFIMQLETEHGQISYHLPMEYWDKCSFAEEQETANKWDGHTSDDVLERLLKL